MLVNTIGELHWTCSAFNNELEAITAYKSLVEREIGRDELCYVEQAALALKESELSRQLKPRGFFCLTVKGLLPLTCFVCLKVFNFPVSLVRGFRLVENEEEAECWDYDDPVFDLIPMNKPELNLLELIEDELILSFPTSVAHPECKL